MRPLVSALAIALLTASTAQVRLVSAQVAELQVGAKVRLRAPGTVAGRLEGIVVARGRDSVTLTSSRPAPVAVPIASITEASVSRGKSHWGGAWKGYLWGAGVGGALGLIGAMGNEKCDAATDSACDNWSVEDVSVIAGFSAAIGAGIGAVIGAERWQRLDFPTRVTLGASRRGLQVGLIVPLRGR